MTTGALKAKAATPIPVPSGPALAMGRLAFEAYAGALGAARARVSWDGLDDATRRAWVAAVKEIEAAHGITSCRACGCTDNFACEGGCSWVEEDLCSACAPAPRAKLARRR